MIIAFISSHIAVIILFQITQSLTPLLALNYGMDAIPIQLK